MYFMTFDTAKSALDLLKKNLILYVPDLFYTVLNYLLIYLLYLYTGAGDALAIITTAETLPLDLLQTYVTENLAKLIISSLVFVIVTFIIGVGVAVMKFSIITNMLKKKKSSLYYIFIKKKGFFWPIVLMRMYVFLISLVAVVIIGALSGAVFLLFKLTMPLLAIAATSVIAVLSTIVLLILVKLAILFRYPIMFLDKEKNALKVLKKSFNLFKNKSMFVLITMLIILAINIVMAVIAWGVGFLSNFSISFINIVWLSITLGVIVGIINLLIDLTAELWGSVYIFLRYKPRKNRK